MKAKDVMTPHVLSVAPDAPISAAARLMLQNRISGLPVVDGSGVGMVTEGDFLDRDRHPAAAREMDRVPHRAGPACR
jgi:CBS domain-containing protein